MSLVIWLVLVIRYGPVLAAGRRWLSQARTSTRQYFLAHYQRWLLWWVVIPEISFCNENSLIRHSCRPSGSPRRRNCTWCFFYPKRIGMSKGISPLYCWYWVRGKRRQANSFHSKGEGWYSLGDQASKLTVVGFIHLLIYFYYKSFILFIWDNSEGQKEEWESAVTSVKCTYKCLLLRPQFNSLHNVL